MNRQTVLVDDIKGMVRIYTRWFGWCWFRFDEFKKSGLLFWNEHPVCRLSDVRRRSRTRNPNRQYMAQGQLTGRLP